MRQLPRTAPSLFSSDEAAASILDKRKLFKHQLFMHTWILFHSQFYTT